MTRMLTLTLGALFAFSAPALAGGDGWLTNLEQAQKQAKAEGKDILVDFTGSDWCYWCKRLKAEVFDKPEFQRYAADNLVLVELDFPRKNRDKISAEQKAYNKQLKEAFGVRGYPTVFVLDADARPYHRTGYKRGGAAAYVKSLESATAQKAELKGLLESSQTATSDEEKGQALSEFNAKLRDLRLPSYGYAAEEEEFIAVAQRLIEADADNAQGHRLRYALELAELFLEQDAAAFKENIAIVKSIAPARAVNLEVRSELPGLKRERNVANKKARLEQLLAMSPTGEALQEVHYLLGVASFRTDRAAAEDHLRKAFAAAPKTRLAARLHQILKRSFPKQGQRK